VADRIAGVVVADRDGATGDQRPAAEAAPTGHEQPAQRLGGVAQQRAHPQHVPADRTAEDEREPRRALQHRQRAPHLDDVPAAPHPNHPSSGVAGAAGTAESTGDDATTGSPHE
jgi:hypothetical protein